jgi:CDP-paratose 2-epimerase
LRRRGEPVPLGLRQHQQGLRRPGRRGLEREGDAYAPRDPALRRHGIGEDRPLDFHTPYGCSKGAADQYVLDYARSFGLPTAVLRMSCIYGPRQMGTEDQGWIAHFLIRALRGEPISVYGDGRQVRDALDVGDAVEAYLAAWARIGAVSGRAFNLGGGPANAVSLRQVIAFIGELTGRPVEARYADWRAGDQRYYVSTRAAPRGSWASARAALARGRRGARALAAGRTRPSAPPGRRRRCREGRARQPALDLREQHLLRLPRAAPSA